MIVMQSANLVVVHAYGSQTDAEMAKSVLGAAEIESMIQSDSAGGMRPHIAWASGGYKLLVREEDETAAHEVLDTSANSI